MEKKEEPGNIGHVFVTPEGAVYMSEGVTPERVLPIEEAFMPTWRETVLWAVCAATWLFCLVVLGVVLWLHTTA